MIRSTGVLLILFFCSTVSFGAVPEEFRTSTLSSRPGFNWVVERSAHYKFYFEEGSPAARDITQIERVMESEYSHITSLLGSTNIDFHSDAFIVSSRKRMMQLCGHESNGLSVGRVLLFVYGEVNALGAHEETHLLSRHLWGAPHGLWITEGLAVYSDDEWQGFQLHGVCKRLHAGGKLLALAALQDDHEFHRTSEMVTYPESGSFIKFLYERYGIDAIRRLWHTGIIAIPTVTGKTLEEIESEWLDVVARSTEATGYDVRWP